MMAEILPATAGAEVEAPLTWRVGRSIVGELNAAVWLIGERDRLTATHTLIESLTARMEPDLLTELGVVFGRERPGSDTYLAALGQLAGVLQEEEYSRATLAMRQLAPADAVAALAATGAEIGDSPDVAAQLATGLDAFTRSVHADLGLESSDPHAMTRRLTDWAAQLLHIMPGGDLHARFWHWMDRFYYESYAPWRVEREAFMQAQALRAIEALGGSEGYGIPKLEWLAPQNPLRSRAGVRRTVTEGERSVFFQVEPFGLIDLFMADDAWLYATFGGPEFQYELFRQASAELAAGAKALADPTRLIILRLIRNFAMDNTEMAEFLEIARPTVSVHAKILREAGLIETRQVGRQARHEIKADAVRRLFDELGHFLDLPTGERHS